MQQILFFVVSFLASVVGAICGIGGGVVIKPVLDLFQLESVATISFLSGCTVLSMSCYSVGRSLLAGEKNVELKTGTPLALGAAVGGIVGKLLFDRMRNAFPDPNIVGAVQAICLMLITVGTVAYTLNKNKIATRKVKNRESCACIGFALGVMSSFLGIGGGPINLVVLYYFFSMDTKTAASNSLYVILFSQAASLIFTIVSFSIPKYSLFTLIMMVMGGIGGGMAGRWFNKRLSNAAVDKLFICLMGLIIFISGYNFWNYAFN